VHQYADYGKYLVCHSVTDSCGTSTLCDTLVNCPDLNATFSHTASGLSVTFTDLSSGATHWFWSFGDGFFSDLKDPVHVFNLTGKYRVCLTVGDNCTSETFCDSINVVPNGILDGWGSGFTVFPVPANDRLVLSFGNTFAGEVDLFVTSSAGVTLMVRNFQVQTGEGSRELDVSGLAPGHYCLKLVMDNKVMVRKFIIIR
jgi:hypothetical protein